MSVLYRPDLHAASYYVTVKFNGMPIERELFLSYDGGRNFVPVPNKFPDKGILRHYYTKTQISIYNIVGYDYFGDREQKIEKIEHFIHFYDMPPRSDAVLKKWGDEIEKRIGSLRSSSRILMS
jgi:hypothetical protein